MPSFVLSGAQQGNGLIILKKSEEGVSEQALARFAAAARRAVKLRGEVAVLITSSREIQKLNRVFRKKDKPTDVLSFPSDAPGVAGDIAISLDVARTNGRKLGHGTKKELQVLILHGMLHLAGMDHEADNGEMARKENSLRKKLHLPLGLIERTISTHAKRKAAK